MESANRLQSADTMGHTGLKFECVGIVSPSNGDGDIFIITAIGRGASEGRHFKCQRRFTGSAASHEHPSHCLRWLLSFEPINSLLKKYTCVLLNA